MCARLLAFLFVSLVSVSARADWPPLEVVLASAKLSSLNVHDANGDVAVAHAAQVGARESSLGNPYLEVTAVHGHMTQDVEVRADLFLPVEVSGQRGARIDEADTLVAWRLGALDEARARVIGSTIAAYGDAVVTRARQLLAQRGRELAAVEAEYQGARLNAGDTTLADSNLAQAEVARWAQLESEASLELIRARGDLEMLVGGQHLDDPPPETTPEPPVLHTGSAVAFAQKVLASAPVLRALASSSRFWDAQRARAEVERTPAVSLILSGGRGDLGEPRLGGGVAWTFPVLHRGRGEIAKAAAEGDRARDLLEVTRRVYQGRAEHMLDAYVLLTAAIRRLDAEGIPAADRVVDAAVAAMKAGKVDILRVFIARRELAAAHSRRLDLVAAAFRLYGNMAALTGDLP